MKTTPDWMTEEGHSLLKKYLAYNETTPHDLYKRISKKASTYLGDEFYEPLYECFWNGWLSPSTPIATNYGASRINESGQETFRGLPVSCFGLKPHNSINGIFKTAHEGALLSKYGGGLGINISSLIGESPVTAWAKIYDLVAKSVSQGGTRRGAVALYLDVYHPDIEAFLQAKEMLEGDPREKLDCNIAIIIPDSFMESLKNGDIHAKKLFIKILELRMKQGSPYIFFVDNANRQRGIDYEYLNLLINTSQLCNEITLYCDENHTFVCVLASLVLSRWDEFKDKTWTINGVVWTVSMLGIALLDAVNQEFIDLGRNVVGLENSVRFAEKSRALGLGVLGWHTYLQKHMISFDSPVASERNIEIFRTIKQEAVEASLLLARRFGVPEWCQKSQQRNTHLLAIAPTLGNSVLCSGGSAGIEPLASNEYVYSGVNGNYLRKNKQLENELEKLNLNTDEVWKQITDNKGSIQFLEPTLVDMTDVNGNKLKSKYIKNFLNVFKTAYEIDQRFVISQASERQPSVCQGQSLNMYLTHDVDAQTLSNLHIMAWKKNLKGLYYIRSTSPRTQSTTLEEDQPVSNWHIITKVGCVYSSRAKSLLKQKGEKFTENIQTDTNDKNYPLIYKNGVLIGGYQDLLLYYGITNELNVKQTQIFTPLKESFDYGIIHEGFAKTKINIPINVNDSDCSACDG